MSEKTFKSVEEQIEILSRRGLNFKEKEYATKILYKISYYDLINGYKDIFLKKKAHVEDDDEYKPGTYFEDIYSLYLFDESLRNLFFKTISKIEVQLNTTLAYVVSKSFGHKDTEYIKHKHFLVGSDALDRHGRPKTRDNGSIIKKRDELIGAMRRVVTNQDNPIAYYRNTHGYVPPWILFKGFTFGNSEALFNLLQEPESQQVISTFQQNFILTNTFSKNFYKSALSILRVFRNWCAHGSRIYNHKTHKNKLPDNHLLEFLNIDSDLDRGRNDILSLIICIYAFLGGDRSPNSEWTSFISEFESIMNTYGASSNSLIFAQVLDEMDLPANWVKISYI